MTRTYFHQIPNSRFLVQIGPAQLLELSFIGGQLETDNETAIAELDKVANVPGSLITTDREAAKELTADQLAAKLDAAKAAAAAQTKLVAAGEKTA